MANTTNYYFNLPVVGGSQNSWGSDLNENWSKLDSLLYGASYTDSDTNTVEKIRPDLDQGNWAINGAVVTASASELNKVDGYNGTTADLNILAGAAAAGVTSTEFGYLDGVTSSLQTQINSVIPSGVILLWSGSTSNIPTGWVLCDGQNSTPDLRDRFVVGAGSTYSVDATGGATSVTLTTSHMPQHSHTFSGTTDTATTIYDDIGTGSNNYFDGGDGGVDRDFTANATAPAHSHTFSGTTDNSGQASPTAVPTIPPYYSLAYIMKS